MAGSVLTGSRCVLSSFYVSKTERQRERRRDRGRVVFHHWLTLYVPAVARAGPGEARKQEFILGLPCGWLGPKCCSPGFLWAGSGNEEVGLEPRHSDRRSEHPKGDRVPHSGSAPAPSAHL